MAIRSMTGFGEGSAIDGDIRVVVELSSVNRKQLDINVSLPRNLMALDSHVQRLVRAVFSRGRISGVVRVEHLNNGAASVVVNEPLVTEYVNKVRAVAQKLQLEDNLGADLMMTVPGLISLDQKQLDVDAIEDLVEKAMNTALNGLTKMRTAEGLALNNDLDERFTLLEKGVKQICEFASTVVNGYREKLVVRLSEAGFADLETDERVLKEIALFADRCDISEELTRLTCHLKQARIHLCAEEPIGRTLDFLCQELFREINTIGSKANDVAIASEVVRFKTELERIREQVQNIE